jgi:hypothetical protein
MGRRGKTAEGQRLKAMRHTVHFDPLNDHIEITVTSEGPGSNCWK